LYGYVESGAVIEIEDRGRRRTAVTQQALERALGKLLTDENFRERFFASPELACWEAGFALSPVELEALSQLPHEPLARFSEGLGSREGRLIRPSNQATRTTTFVASATR